MIGNWVLAFDTVENNQLFSPLCTVCGEKHEHQQQTTKRVNEREREKKAHTEHIYTHIPAKVIAQNYFFDFMVVNEIEQCECVAVIT